MYYDEQSGSAVVGYARIITDGEGKTIYVDDLYCPDMNIEEYVGSYTEMLDDICSEKDSLVLVTFGTWSEKYWTDCGWEYDGGLNPINVIVLKDNYKEFRKKQLRDYKNLFSQDEEINDELKEMISIYEEIYDEDFKDGEGEKKEIQTDQFVFEMA